MVMPLPSYLPAASLLLYLATSGCGSSSAEPLQGIKGPDGVPVAYQRAAPNHVVTYAYWRGFGAKDGDRVTVWRRGRVIRQRTEYLASKRESDHTSESFNNLATLASVSGSFGNADKISHFSLRRETPTTLRRYRYRMVPTNELSEIAGETCRRWRADPIGEPGAVFTGVARRACIAADGVVLYEAWLYGDGKVAEERTAIRVNRRPVAVHEVLPPREILNWAAWLRRAGEMVPLPTGRSGNYDLVLSRNRGADDAEGGGDRQRLRAADHWTLEEESVGQRVVRRYLVHASRRLLLMEDEGSLSIDLRPPSKDPAALSPLAPSARGVSGTRTILGEECRFVDAAPNVTDYSRADCRTQDGLPLLIMETSWGTPSTPWTAKSLIRGKTKAGDLMPNWRTLSWAAWGWPELAQRRS